jgi:soluble lytic murein transglycosylase
MKYLTFFHLIFLLSAIQASLAIANNQDSLGMESARQMFQHAEQALSRGDHATYHQLINKLQHYPLLPYLEYQEIRQRFHTLTPDQVRSALQKLSYTPLEYQLRRDWLKRLAKQNRWSTYLQFSIPGGRIAQQCHRMHAMLKTGQRNQALQAVEPIWLNGYSQPKACDPVLNAWIDSGHLTDNLVWQRIDLAMQNNQTRLARYLKRFLSSADQVWVDRWIELHQKPKNLARLLRNNHPYVDEIVVDSLKRLVRKDPIKALNTWQEIHNDARFSEAQHLSVARTLASFLAFKNDRVLMQRLRKLVPPVVRADPKFNDKLLQVALRQNDWNLVSDIIENLTPEEQQNERWRYWYARALSRLGKQDAANDILTDLAKTRSYYGFMAADLMGFEFNFNHQSLPVSEAILEQVATIPGLIRARELFALGRMLEARREWNMALQDKSTVELKAAAKLAQTWNWPFQTILTLARVRYWNDLELRFPLHHQQHVDRQAKDHGLESAWIYAILRQESAFSVDARSQAGAIGLMQLMPATAKEVASKTRKQPLKANDLFRPEINIELGTSYLNQIFNQLQQNPVLATAAYNAGPSRVKKWLPEQPQATDVWIETVPFSETREYLKRVLAYTVIYNHRLGNNPEQLPEQWQKPIGAAHERGKMISMAGSDT